MARMNRKLVVLFLVLVVSAVIGLGVFMLMGAETNPDPYVERGRSLMAVEKYAEAVLPLTRANDITRGRRADVLAMIGECYLKTRPEPDYPKARAYYLRAKAMAAPDDPKRIEYIQELVKLHWGSPEAVVQIKDLIKAQPDNDDHYRLLSFLYLESMKRATALTEQQSFLQQAMEAADKAVEVGPKNLANYVQKAQCLYAGQKADAPAEAEAIIRKAIPEVDDKAGAHSVLGGFYLGRAGNVTSDKAQHDSLLTAAETEYNEALKINPDSYDALIGLGRVAMGREDAEQAEKWLRQAVEKNNKGDMGYYLLSYLLRRASRQDEALKVLRDFEANCDSVEKLEKRRDREAVDRWFAMMSMAADILMSTGQLDEARQQIERVSAKVPGHPSVPFGLGKLAFLQRHFEEAFTLFQKAVDAQQEAGRRVEEYRRARYHRDEAEYRLWLGRAYDEFGLPGRALGEYNEALALVRDGDRNLALQIRHRRVMTLYNLRSYDQAAQEARNVLVILKDNDLSMLRVLASSLVALNDPAGALPVAQKCMEVAPDRWEGYVTTAFVLQKLDKAAEAEDVLLKGLDKAGPKVYLYEALVHTYLQAEDRAKIQSLMERARKDEGLSESELLRLGLIQAATADDRLAMLREASAKDPENPVKLSNMARVLNELGQAEEALKTYKQAYDLAVAKKNQGIISLIWGDVWHLLLTTSDPDEARAWVRELPDDMTEARRRAEGLLEIVNVGDPPKSEIEGRTPYEILKIKIAHADKAIGVFKRVLDEGGGPPDVGILRGLARAHILKATLDTPNQLAELRNAEQHLTQVIAMRPQDVGARLDLATVQMSLLNYDGALAQAEDILRTNAKDINALRIKSEALRSKADYRKAVEAREAIRAVVPQLVSNLLQMGALYEVLGETDAAVAAYREAVGAAPDNPDPVLQLARLLYGLGTQSRAEADALVQSLVAKTANKATARLIDAQYYGSTNRLDEAIVATREAMAADPDNEVPVVYLGKLMTEVRTLEGYQEAVKACDDFLARHPKALEVQLLLADILTVSELDLDKAEKVLTTVLEAMPNHIRARTVLARVWSRKGGRDLAAGKGAEARRWFGRARKELDQILEQQPNYGDAHVSLAELCYQEGDKAKAVENLGKVRTFDPAYLRALQRRAQINLELGRAVDSRLDLENMVRVEPGNLLSRLRLAEFYTKSQMFPQAEALLKEGLTKYAPDHPLLLASLVEVLLAQKKIDEADSTADRAIRVAPTTPIVWRRWVDVRAAQGRIAEAETRIRALQQQYPESIDLLHLLVDILNTSGKYSESITLLEGRLQKFPADVLSYIRIVDTILISGLDQTTGRFDPEAIKRAETWLLQALKPTSRHRLILIKLTELYEAAGLWIQGEKAAKEVVDRYPEDAVAMVRLGECTLNQGRSDEAYAWFEKAVGIDPTQYVAWNNMAWVLATEKKDLDKAEACITKALNLAPGHPDILDTAGWIRYLRGDHRGAIELLERSVAARDMPGTHYHLGMAHRLRSSQLSNPADKTKAAADARQHLELYLSKEPNGKYAQPAREALKELETSLKE